MMDLSTWQIWWYYYWISGLICFIDAHKSYPKILKQFPIVEYISRELFALIIGVLGFVVFPVTLCKWIRDLITIIYYGPQLLYKRWRNKRLRRKINKQTAEVLQLLLNKLKEKQQ